MTRLLPEPKGVQRMVIVAALMIVALLLVAPLIVVFTEAFRHGLGLYAAALRHEDARAALQLTVTTASIAVVVNAVFGTAAAWALTRTRMRGKRIVLVLIDLPLAVSPVIAGMIFILVYGKRGWLGPWLETHNISVIFAAPGIVLAMLFVTLPLVARELIPLMQAQGTDEEQAAAVLGANAWQTFVRVTLPNIKWALIYGVILTNARAMGEFGAVSVVSGHIRGVTTTLPLHVETLYNEYEFAGAFAVASVLTGLAILTLGAQSAVEWRQRRLLARSGDL